MELEKFKASHFDNIDELIKTCKLWINDDDYEAYCRFFDMGAMEELIKEIQQLEKERDGIYQDYQDLGKEYHKLQEESIPRAIVEDRVKELKLIREEEEKTRFVLSYSIYNAITNEIDDLEQILNKGE